VYHANLQSITRNNNKEIKHPIFAHIMKSVAEAKIDYERFNITQLIHFLKIFIRAPTDFYFEERARAIRKFSLNLKQNL
jgi:hypothetical protein